MNRRYKTQIKYQGIETTFWLYTNNWMDIGKIVIISWIYQNNFSPTFLLIRNRQEQIGHFDRWRHAVTRDNQQLGWNEILRLSKFKFKFKSKFKFKFKFEFLKSNQFNFHSNSESDTRQVFNLLFRLKQKLSRHASLLKRETNKMKMYVKQNWLSALTCNIRGNWFQNKCLNSYLLFGRESTSIELFSKAV